MKKFLIYLSLPEMILFWVMLVVMLFLMGIIFYFVAPPWKWAGLIVGLLFILISFFIDLRNTIKHYNLLSEREQVRTIISHFTDAIVAYDPDFRITVFNAAAEDLFNLKASDILNQIITPEWAKNQKTKLLTQVLFPSLAPSMSWKTDPAVFPNVMELSFTNPALELTVTTIRVTDSKGKILGFFKIIKDRTREEEILKTKSEFLTVAAHQMRTPLSGIKWSLETLLSEGNENLTDTQRELLQKNLEATDKILRLANDLLDVANIESGRFGYEFVQSDLIDLIQKSISEYLYLADQHKIKIYFEPPSDGLPPFKFDPMRIKIVIQNLLENALRYNIEGGQIIIKVEKKPPYVEVSVSDTGIGIPKEELPKLFTKFFRASNVLKYETEGTGLGLYITRNIVEAHGGKIWAESIENRGTTMHFTLPMDEKLIPKRYAASAI
ncbi:MAG TPA: ATP-binding protein [Candidatus Paceibacterota bacterium]|nr:ATP-binding protein [Candidatus Paceibacterota bacterium]HOL54227.1 ATP-binding protein [Candidatus Paceibacterota bacterium]HON21804.1 ATP-binding protein [Candidatus Paceibacterota bacterium]HOV88993.1 ATP-binding protein [Candidatus Paceibacterota bacterium]HPP17252.1 ATP-binding protein [Candidatus Paceibacterota bacterium]